MRSKSDGDQNPHPVAKNATRMGHPAYFLLELFFLLTFFFPPNTRAKILSTVLQLAWKVEGALDLLARDFARDFFVG